MNLEISLMSFINFLKPIVDSFKRVDFFCQSVCWGLKGCQIIFEKNLHVILVYVSLNIEKLLL